MGPDHGTNRQLGVGSNHLALGFTFAAGVVFFTLSGLALDRWLHLTPLFTLAGALVGTVLSFVHVFMKLQQEVDERARERKTRQ